MDKFTRRDFMKGTLAAGLTLSLPGIVRPASANSVVRLAIIGLGGINVTGGVGGRGRQLLNSFRKVPGARVVALCDPDQTILAHGAELCAQAGLKVATHRDLRKVLDDPAIDAVVVATPDHWHALATVWACQAGKDVYVEKPMSYNLWEGRRIVAAARKYGRIVQVGTQGRSSTGLAEAFEFLRSGQLGKIRYAQALNYRIRQSIGKVSAPTPIPATMDYDLWSGPAPLGPLRRKQLHYDWHWVWSHGTGETGNNGVHYLDMCRWALGLNTPPRRVMSIGGRFGYDDDGETPNANVVLLDYASTPVICQIRGLPEKPGSSSMGNFRGQAQGILIQCEGGYFRGKHEGGSLFDNQDKKIRDFMGKDPEVAHLVNFIEAVRDRDGSRLRAPALEGHLSAGCSHMANISYRVGAANAPEAIAEATRGNAEFAEAFELCRENLRANGIDIGARRCVLGPWVSLDDRERFVGEFAEQANALAMRQNREPFVFPADV